MGERWINLRVVLNLSSFEHFEEGVTRDVVAFHTLHSTVRDCVPSPHVFFVLHSDQPEVGTHSGDPDGGHCCM